MGAFKDMAASIHELTGVARDEQTLRFTAGTQAQQPQPQMQQALKRAIAMVNQTDLSHEEKADAIDTFISNNNLTHTLPTFQLWTRKYNRIGCVAIFLQGRTKAKLDFISNCFYIKTIFFE
jgi:hypothetical protein